MDEKEYWEQIIGLTVLLFTTYTITKDLITEKTVPIITYLYNSGTISAIIYAGILDIILIIGFRWQRNHLKKQGKFE